MIFPLYICLFWKFWRSYLMCSHLRSLIWGKHHCIFFLMVAFGFTFMLVFIWNYFWSWFNRSYYLMFYRLVEGRCFEQFSEVYLFFSSAIIYAPYNVFFFFFLFFSLPFCLSTYRIAISPLCSTKVKQIDFFFVWYKCKTDRTKLP